jgi:AraC-like DNA-binding protein
MTIPLPKSQRVELYTEHFGLPEIPLWGIDRQTYAEDGLPEHDHQGNLEIHYLLHGEQIFHVDGAEYRMAANDLFVTVPFERHSSGGHPHGRGELYWMQILLSPLCKGFLGLERKEALSLVRQLQTLPCRHFAGNKIVRTLFEDIFLLAQKEIPNKELALSSRIVQWLLEVIACSHVCPAGSPTPDIRQVLEYVQHHPFEMTSLEKLAEISGLSLSHFKTKFRNQLGLPPGEYLMRQKMKLAEELLKSSKKSITQIAYDLGFSSSQYFATVFKRFTFHKPCELRK